MRLTWKQISSMSPGFSISLKVMKVEFQIWKEINIKHYVSFEFRYFLRIAERKVHEVVITSQEDVYWHHGR